MKISTIPESIRSHSQYHPADYAYLSEKGYSDSEILTIWDRDAASGKPPQTHENQVFSRITNATTTHSLKGDQP